MRKLKDLFQLSASDISNYLGCHHLTELEKQAMRGEIEKPEWNNPHAGVLQEMGYEHEEAYIEHLKSMGLTVAEIPEDFNEHNFDLTLKAMEDGKDIIVQGILREQDETTQWFGKLDILKKVPGKSKFGDYMYEVMDTKLSRETKGSAILQLCLYSEMLANLTESSPRSVFIVTPGETFVELEYKLDEYLAYYRLVKDKLIEAVKNTHKTYPEPVLHCDICRWWEVCASRRRSDDHLSLVAGISSRHRKDLEENNISTMEGLALSKADTHKSLDNINAEIFEKIQKQAQIQVKGRNENKNLYEIIETPEGKGLSRLPEPTCDDIFFDIEGDTFAGLEGQEYLLGFSYLEGKELKYDYKWGLTRKEEKKAFEWFIDNIIARLKENPAAHIYHYAPYEPSACKRMAQKFSTREAEVDQLLRAGKFIDLYQIVRQGVRASVEKYSIKDLEVFTDYERKIPLIAMGVHKRALEHSLELEKPQDITDEMKNAVLIYNQDDTDSTYFLQQWLERLRTEAEFELFRPELREGESDEFVSEREIEINKVKEKLTKGIEEDEDSRNDLENVKVLLSELMSFYNREDKVSFWDKYARSEMDYSQLYDERAAIVGLNLKAKYREPRARTDTHEFSYPYQETEIGKGDDIYLAESTTKIGQVREIDKYNRILKFRTSSEVMPKAIYTFNHVNKKLLEEASLNFGNWVIENDLEGSGKFQALRDILLRRPPQLKSGEFHVDKSKPLVDEAVRIVTELNNSYLPIQGPPGAGKSYTGSRMIAELVSKGYKVGVTAVSHKVIAGLLESAAKAISSRELECRVIHKKKPSTDSNLIYEELDSYGEIEELISSEDACVVGGTSWMFSRESFVDQLDYLFIDEGGQLSLSNVVSVGASSKNIVILGDCKQLEQPIQASHPSGADKSALEHIQGDNDTIPENMGIFLPITYRLHPNICAFNSELFYDGRLQSVEGNESQVINGKSPYNEKSLMLDLAEHSGNSNYSLEEVKRVKKIVTKLTDGKHTYTVFNNLKNESETHTLTLEDIMVVAPYNAQVQRLKESIPGLNCGTVDKFQGREAPVVIYSVTTSSPEEAPRGMDFLYSGNRLNVAVSRAQCLFVMVATSAIFDPNCKSPGQMKLANAYCRFLEMIKGDIDESK